MFLHPHEEKQDLSMADEILEADSTHTRRIGTVRVTFKH